VLCASGLSPLRRRGTPVAAARPDAPENAVRTDAASALSRQPARRFTLPRLCTPGQRAATGMIGRVTLLLSRSDLERLLDVDACLSALEQGSSSASRSLARSGFARICPVQAQRLSSSQG